MTAQMPQMPAVAVAMPQTGMHMGVHGGMQMSASASVDAHGMPHVSMAMPHGQHMQAPNTPSMF